MGSIPEGYGLIAGRSRANAQAALDAAAKAGVDVHEVTATSEGYVVPLDVLDLYAKAQGVDGPAVEDTPTADWKNADIKAWADDHDVELEGATTKADMLAAIDAAGAQ